MHRTRFPTRSSAEVALFVLVAGAVLYSYYKPSHRSRELLDVMLALLLVAAAALSPRRFFSLILVTLVFIPYGAIRSTAQFPGEPTALLASVLAVAVAASPRPKQRRPPVTAIDICVAALVILMLGAVIDGQQTFDTWLQQMILWIGPYCGMRLIGQSASNRRLAAQVLVAGAAVLVPFVAIESATGFNPFFHLAPGEASTYLHTAAELRGGGRRASASFFDPIALAMFFAVAIMLGAGLAIESGSRRARLCWTTAVGLIVIGELLTISRTAWLMLAVGVVAAAVLMPDPRLRRGIRWAIVPACIALIALGQFGPSSISAGIPFVGKSTAATRASSTYRSELLSRALNRRLIHPFGNKTNNLANLVVQDYASVDNEYLYFADQFGYVPVIALIALLPILVLLAVFRRTSARAAGMLDVMYLCAGIALLVAVFTVAFITQQQVLFWLILGACSAIVGASSTTLLLKRPISAVAHG